LISKKKRKQNMDGENEDLTLILRKKMETFADTSAFNAGVKEKNTKTNKITIVKNQKLIFLPDVSDVWRWKNPVKTRNVPFLLQNPQWNQRMNSHEPCL
jgi:hypothetical protein